MNTYLHHKATAFRTALSAVVFIFSFLAAATAHPAPPAFEAYYKFYLGNTHAGYVIQRLEVLDSKKEMISYSYSYVKTPTGTSIESLVARCDLNFEPISYSYNSLSDGKPKTIDATFKMKKMTAKITELAPGRPGQAPKARSKVVTLQVPANGFLSTFLNYVMLKNGLSPGKGYTFYALSEEDPGFHQGTANIISEQKLKNNIDTFKINIRFKDVSFTALVAANGEPIGTNSPMQNASTEMVATRAEAVGSLPFSEKPVKALFGNIPEGRQNKMNTSDTAQLTGAPSTTTLTTDAPKSDKPKGQ